MNEIRKRNKVVLKDQGLALSRLVEHDDRSVTEIAKQVGVDRQSIYIWMRGDAAIPEEKLNILSEMYHVHPSEIRYDVSVFNEQDLIDVVISLENELDSRGKTLNATVKAKVISRLYQKKQDLKRTVNFSYREKDFTDELNSILDLVI